MRKTNKTSQTKKIIIKNNNNNNSNNQTTQTITAKRNKHAFLKNVAIFLSAFVVLYLFFVLTFGNISNNTNKTVYYALSSGSFENTADAYSEADKIKLLGGGGNVWQDGKEYQVLAFVYNDVSSASEVQTRLQSDDLNLEIVVMEINTSKLETEEKQFVDSMLEISSRLYELLSSMPEYTSETQTQVLLEEINKSMQTSIARAQLLASSDQSKENIIVTGSIISDAFLQVSSSQTITTQNVAWLRTQILIYAIEFAENC